MPGNQRFRLVSAAVAACGAVACRAPQRPPTVSRAGPALGAVFSVAAWGDDSSRVRAAVDQAFDTVARLDATLSSSRSASEVSRLDRIAGTGPQPVSRALFAVLREVLDVRRATAGAVSPVTPAVPGLAIDSVRQTIGLPHGAELVVGRVSRGFALDRALTALAGAVDSAILSLGGQYLTRTAGPRTIGVADADNSLNTVARITLPTGTWGVSTVSPVEEPDGVDDPRTGRPAERVRVVTVVGPRAAVAAAWSLAAYVVGCDSALTLAPRHGVDLLCVDGNRARWTPGLEGRVVLGATGSTAPAETAPAPAPAPAPAAGGAPSGSTTPAASPDSSR
jgi:FAD:protein FMN transferase